MKRTNELNHKNNPCVRRFLALPYLAKTDPFLKWECAAEIVETDLD